MKVICAWCRKVLKGEDIPGGEISHGICPQCLERLMGVRGISLAEFVNTLEFPILMTNRDWVVVAANQPAATLLGQPVEQLRGAAPGVAIQCMNSLLPGGCGKSEHCAGCTLRKTIADVYADGEPRYGTYSAHDLMAGGGSRPVRFRFSAVRAGESVMVSIDAVEIGDERP